MQIVFIIKKFKTFISDKGEKDILNVCDILQYLFKLIPDRFW